MRTATRRMISTFGALTGLAGVEHGLGEVLQGRRTPEGIFIQSWPESEFFRFLSGEPAMSLLPDMLLTGVLAILFSLAYLSCAIWFVQRKKAGLVLMLLAVAMLLAGGGIFPPIFGLLIGFTATRLHAPLDGWRERLSPGLAERLGRLWPWAFGASLLAWLSMFPGVPMLSYFLSVESVALVLVLLVSMFGFLFVAVIAALASDLQAQSFASFS